jgi:hypothetical protein
MFLPLTLPGVESTFFMHSDAAEYLKQSKDTDVSLATPYL